MAVITEDYRRLNSRLHETRPDYGVGHSSSRHYSHIDQMARSLGARSLLDYGCGKGALARALSHLLVEEYDPAIPGKDSPPAPADFVVCTDVLEHIEPDCLDDVLDDLKRCTLKGIFMTIATRPAAKTLEDGRNAHLIQQGPDWWLPKLMARWEMRLFQASTGEFAVFGLSRAATEVRAVAA